jgi:hypothetical protein
MERKDLDHDQDKTDVLVKSVKPDGEFMDEECLCVRCHGPKRVCEREDCPQKRGHK